MVFPQAYGSLDATLEVDADLVLSLSLGEFRGSSGTQGNCHFFVLSDRLGHLLFLGSH